VSLGDEDWRTVHPLLQRASALRRLGRWDKSERDLHHAHSVLRATLGERDVRTADAASALGSLYHEWNSENSSLSIQGGMRNRSRKAQAQEKAVEYWEAARRGFEASQGQLSMRTLGTLEDLGRAYDALGRVEEAAGLWEHVLGCLERVNGQHNLTLEESLQNLRVFYWPAQIDTAIVRRIKVLGR
jgi:tetratricopeptide (TPR) repeat protein